MSRSVVHVVTVHCGIPECSDSVVCGDNEKYAEDRGWKLDVPILDTYYDLCPDHLQILQDFVAPPEIVSVDDAQELTVAKERNQL